MSSLYHVYNTANHERIHTDGLRGVDWVERCDAWGLPLSPVDARDVPRPDGAADAFEVGRAIAEHIFEDERPPGLPSRRDTVFFYADREHAVDSLDASYNVAVVDDADLDGLVCGDDEWKTHVMGRTIACVRGKPVHITETHLRDAARRYWTGITDWPRDEDASVRLEVFGAECVPAAAIAETIVGAVGDA